MNDKKDDYYQPWLRDPAAPAEPAARPAVDEGLARPTEPASIRLDADRPERAALTDHRRPEAADRMKKGTRDLLQAARRGATAFAEWTIAVGERADIPARVEAMEIPRRSREMMLRTGERSARVARALGRGTTKAGRNAARLSGDAWNAMALGDKVANLTGKAGQGLVEVADKTKAGIGQVAKAGKDSIGEAAGKLRPAPRENLPPPSGLEQLLAREEAEAKHAAGPAGTPDLPLFAGEPIPAAPADQQQVVVENDDRTPHVAAPAKSRPSARSRAMTSGRLPHVENHGGVLVSRNTWVLGALAALVLVAASFWLGGRFGGGMSKGEVETIVANYIKANPEIIPQALEAQRDREIAKAIGAIRPALEKPYAGAWAGNADGDVTLVVFTDYACGFCRASLPDIDRLVREDKRLKVVFRELPIISPQSRDAAIMALAAARQGKYDAFHHAMFAASSLDPSAIAAAAEKAGVVTDGSADATANEALFQRELDSNLAIATQLQLNATPTWVIGDQLFQGQVGYDTLRRAIAKARSKD